MLLSLEVSDSPRSSSARGGPYDKRTKWWQGDENILRRCEGFRSKKAPGVTMT